MFNITASMLTPPNGNHAEQTLAPNSASLPTAFNGQPQSQHHHQPQNQPQHQHFNQDDRQRQDALASLFRSLSNLASDQQHQQQQQYQTNCLIDAINGCSQNLVTNNNRFLQSNQSAAPQPPPPPTSLPMSANNDTITSSLQSVVAAAVMQQQLVSAALNRAPQTTPLMTHPQSHPPPPPAPPSIAPPPTKTTTTAMTTLPPPPILHNPSMTHANTLSFFNEQQSRAGAFPLLGRAQPQPAFLDLEHDMQYTPATVGHKSQQQAQLQPNPQQQQRINYCTICNKELCNKYFMKTHMLKMHGINLEMEHSQEPEATEEGQSSGSTGETLEGEASGCKPGEERKSPVDKKYQIPSSCSSSSSSSSSASLQPTNLSKQVSKNNEKSSQAQSAGAKKSSASSNGSSGAATKQATSVMNGFAGNSMGGVVCDICNKELCSKYFLKVHKQNTHGITTDYQDASQFVYPFGNPLAAPNPFMTPMSMGPLGVQTGGPPVYSSTSVFDQCHSKNPSSSGDVQTGKKLKRARTTKDSRSKAARTNPVEPMTTDSCNQLNNVYRLMLQQQEQQQQQPGQHQQNQQQQQPNTIHPPFMSFDPMLANSMGALMCFGAMGPFGPAGISPTMIVEMILRNQHLFTRGSFQSSQGAQQPTKSGKEKSGAESKSKASSTGKSSKDANNSRYFTHYTEACPMCDRRFKSIKWLKTHMMNDHKQELGTYMQMMMQQLYLNKGQQAMCPQLNSAASFELKPPQPASSCFPVNMNSMCNQQRAAPQHYHQPPAQQNLLSLSNQMMPANTTDSQRVNVDQQPQQAQNQQLSLVQDYLNQQKQIMQQKLMLDCSAAPAPTIDRSMEGQDLAIDARCKQESLSPAHSDGCKGLDGGHALDDGSLDDQLDLTSKFIVAERQADSNDDFAARAQALIRSDRLEASSFFLDNNNNNNDADDDAVQVGGLNDDCSTKSSYQDELDQNAADLPEQPAHPRAKELGQEEQIIKTTSASS